MPNLKLTSRGPEQRGGAVGACTARAYVVHDLTEHGVKEMQAFPVNQLDGGGSRWQAGGPSRWARDAPGTRPQAAVLPPHTDGAVRK